MNETDYWAKFMATGKIDDFLAYRNAEDAQAQVRKSKEAAGEYSHAGIYTDYRNGFKG
ncbi:MAG: hypothetical protein HDR13_08015 [Lachnospiraceae bacterium]|nr:hypothetical protein [Lachnospiraceae bacterium]MBD5488727.1 hypothetical protein [Lachnospiraceae bacterium]MBD5524724.1 hypothetical protein [Lachnospiraceae bacterium]